MEIHNNNISPIVKEKVSVRKKPAKNTVESKTTEADSLKALAFYGMAQVNSVGFKGNSVKTEIDVPQEKRLNIINMLGIKDRDEIEALLRFSGFQFVLVSAFLYIGADINAAEKEFGGAIEEITEKENEDLVNYFKKSKTLLINEPQKVIDFVKYMRDKNVSFDDKNTIATILISLNEASLDYAKELLDDETKPIDIMHLAEILSVYTKETESFIRKILKDTDDKFSENDKLLILTSLTPENVSFAEELTEKESSKYKPQQIKAILSGTNKYTIDFVKKVLSDDTLGYNTEEKAKLIRILTKDNLDIAQELLYKRRQDYDKEDINNILFFVNDKNKSLAMDLITDTSANRIENKDIARILSAAKEQTVDFIQNFIKRNDNYDIKEKTKILYNLNYKNTGITQRLVSQKKDKRISADTINNILLRCNFNDLQIDIVNNLIDLYENNEIELQDYIGLILDVEEDTFEFIKQRINVPKENRCSAKVIEKMLSLIKDNSDNQYSWDYSTKPKIDKFKFDFAKYLAGLSEKGEIDLDKYCDLINLINENNVSLIKKMLEAPKEIRFVPDEKKLFLTQISKILEAYTPETEDYINNLISVYPIKEITDIAEGLKPCNLELAKNLTNKNSRFTSSQIGAILKGTNDYTVSFVSRLLSDEKSAFKEDELSSIIATLKEDNLDIAQKLIYGSKRNYSVENIRDVLLNANKDNKAFIMKLLSDENLAFTEKELSLIIETLNEDNLDIAQKLIYIPNQEYTAGNIRFILQNIGKHNKNIAWDLISDNSENKFEPKDIGTIIFFSKEETVDFIRDFIKQNNNYDNKDKLKIIQQINNTNVNIAKRLVNMPENKLLGADTIAELLYNVYYSSFEDKKVEFADYLADIYEKGETDINKYIPWISYVNDNNFDLMRKLIQESDKLPLTEEEKITVITNFNNYGNNKEKVEELYQLIDLLIQGHISKRSFLVITNIANDISLNDIRKLENIMGKEKVDSLSDYDLVLAAQCSDLCNRQNINEIPINKKKYILRKLLAINSGLFYVSDVIKEYFPLVPKNQEEYCALMPALVKSLGIETNSLSEDEVREFNTSLVTLSKVLKNMTDIEFDNIKITQEYPKSEFIKDAYTLVKDLSSQERQKVYDYFGFELYLNSKGTKVDDKENNKYSLIGYPVNLNNGKKLAQITDPATKEIIEQLREKVIKFSQDNKILCNNSQIQLLLNNIVKAFPELRTQIEKIQHSAHKYDIMQHSLKVMQKIVQNTDFDKLPDSDKRVMLICALLHDGNKSEGVKDKVHAEESAFDAYYIINKLNLSREEKIKIYSLIRHHEWLGYVNNYILYTQPDSKKQQSVAFDLQYDNLFDLAKIFTIADLKAVKEGEGLYLKYKADFENHSEKIEGYIKELKKTQPLLPVTRIPKASRIEKAITEVKEDGSTNIKGVYKNKDGLVIIKYNEVENDTWEKIGFPKGSISRGIDADGFTLNQGAVKAAEDVNTGNIKFFVHGLDYSNQLAKFDAFALPDSDALLSVSYAERPESKYRFFRTQGVILTTPTKYMHGGGETDAGSGFGKNLDLFKTNYIFGGHREKDRKYISNLIKEALNMTDEEYVKFVKENADKPFTSIEPEDVRNTIIKAFSTINSNTRLGNRAYNEMYITNPEVMGVFAYSPEDKVGNILSFADSQPEFLKKYALDNDLPFVVFGD